MQKENRLQDNCKNVILSDSTTTNNNILVVFWMGQYNVIGLDWYFTMLENDQF